MTNARKDDRSDHSAVPDERLGLLSNVHTVDATHPHLEEQPTSSALSGKESKSRRSVGFSVLLSLILATTVFQLWPRIRQDPACGGDVLYSNGTHEFKKTVLMISIDGFRADYLDRGFTPHLLDISREGVRAEYMKPVFSTLTFPNHWSLLTGLYAESHGIIANDFWDPVFNDTFDLYDVTSTKDPRWYLGEPMWETAERAGIITANLMWPGPWSTSSGVKSTYFLPRVEQPLETKISKLLEWIDLPLEKRPQLILGYDASVDHAGHETGPMSEAINTTLVAIDLFILNLTKALSERNLSHIVNVILVSDHGMADTSHPTFVYVDDIIGQLWEGVITKDGWPSMGLRFTSDLNVTRVLENLCQYVLVHPGQFDLFTTESFSTDPATSSVDLNVFQHGALGAGLQPMPERYHFSANYRLAPVWIIPRIGYALTYHEDRVEMLPGNHGYDNDDPSMHALFVAHGPFSKGAKSALTTRVEGQDDYLIPGFQNVEIYNLVMRLLGIDSRKAAKTNGTAEFWDAYLLPDA